MSRYSHSTNFYLQDVYQGLQHSGAFIVVQGRNWLSERCVLISPTGEQFLVGNAHWLRGICSKYKIPFSTLNWELLSHDWSVPSEQHLYQTEFGAHTLTDAMEMRRLQADLYARDAKTEAPLPFDNYSNAEDTFIDQHGMSSGLD